MDKGVIGSIKSTSGTINHFVDAVSSGILGTNEQLSSSPTSFLNILLDEIGSLNSANFYESMIMKQEAHKSTAKSKRSLLRYLDSKEFVGVLGNPSTFTFGIGFLVSELINNSIVDPTDKMSQKLTINKNSIISLLDKPSFTFDYDIDIYTKKVVNPIDGSVSYTHFAKFRPEIGDVIPSITNPFIQSVIQVVGTDKYFMMKIATRQYNRNIKDYNYINSSTMKYEYDIPYSNNLYAFEVFYKPTENSELKLLNGVQDGLFNQNGYTYSLRERTNGVKSIVIKFSRNPDKFTVKPGSSLQIVTYTTEGSKGNFIIPNWNTDIPPISGIQFVQNRDIAEEDALFNMIPTAIIYGPEATGGRDEMDIDNLRNFVIRKSDSKTLTLIELEELAKQSGMRMTKERADVLEIYFKLIGYIENNNTQISTTPGLIVIDIENLIKSDSDTYLLTPKDFFNFSSNNNDGVLSYISDISKNTDYISRYNSRSTLPWMPGTVDDVVGETYSKGDVVSYNGFKYKSLTDNNTNKKPTDNPSDWYIVGNERDYFFPYFMKLEFKEYVNASVYNMYIDNEIPTVFDYFNDSSISQIGINSCRIYRNPTYSGTINIKNNIKEYSDYYDISFEIQVSDTFYRSIILPTNISNITNFKSYIRINCQNESFFINDNNVSIKKYSQAENPYYYNNNILTVNAILETDNLINDEGRLHITGNSLIPFPNTSIENDSFFIEDVIDIKVYVAMKGVKASNSVDHLGIIPVTDILNVDGIGAIYNINDVKLFTDLTDIIKPIVDIKMKKNFHKFINNVYETYPDDVIALDVNGEQILETITIKVKGVDTSYQVPKIKNHKGSILKEIINNIEVPVIAYPKDSLIYTNINIKTIKENGVNYDIVDYDNITPISKLGDSIVCELVDIPLIDRIHSGSGYINVIKAFDNLINKIESMYIYAPTGTSCKLGVFDTVSIEGTGYVFIDKTKNNVKFQLDRLALSLNIGVKPESSIVDTSILKESINIKILEYMRINSSADILSFMELLNYVKNNVSGIQYCELYTVNSYSPGSCQTLTFENTKHNGILTIKNIVDESSITNNDIDNFNIKFKPDITISFIY